MGDDRHEIARKKLVYRAAGMDAVRIRRDVVYAVGKNGDLTMDLYYPEHNAGRVPAVILVAGYPDVGVPLMFGCRFKEMDLLISWSQVIAAHGMAAIVYSNENPAQNLPVLLDYVRSNATSLGLNENKLALHASSGNVPNALSVLMGGDESVRCAVLNYGYMLDLDGTTAVADASRAFRFANPCVGKTVDDLRADVPLLITRAGKEQFPGLNDSIDRFTAKALARNLPITLSNLPSAPHSYDMIDDTAPSHKAIEQMLAFLRFHLLD
jgi:hypothetical protein